MRVLSVVLLGLVAVFGLGAPAGAAGNGDLVKVFVVKDPAQTGGQLAGLQSIAASTLGDASRADEILQLNKGLAQPDGGALNSATDQLHPGWILRLPQDASGPDVQLAKDTGAQAGAGGDGQGAAPPATGQQGGAGTQPATTAAKPEYLTLPLPAALGAAGAVLAALVTAAILARRQLGRGAGALVRAVRRLGDPARRRRRLQARRSLGERFAADTESVRRAYGTLDDFGSATHHPAAPPVHALRVDARGVTVWVPPTERVPAPWSKVDDTRWRRSAAGAAAFTGAPARSAPAQVPDDTACLVRVGSDDDGEQVFVDLSRLDGVLSVTGEHAVARDVVRTVLGEIARTRPGTPVTVLRGTDGAAPIEVPAGLEQLARVEEGQRGPRPVPAAGALRPGAARRPVRGVVVMAGTPTAREAAELQSLCGPGGAGWTGLVCGDAEGAHWRWHTDAEGGVDIPVLGVRLTVPA